MTQEQYGASVRIAPNGPYLVKGEIPLRGSDERVLQAPASYVLCRCGGEGTKPFCDGTHLHNGFDGRETADRGSVENRWSAYRAQELTIFDDRSICAHAGVCTGNLATVFKLGAEPWIDPDGAPADAIKAIIDRCPSGALSYAASDDIPGAGTPATRIALLKNGPIAVDGNVPLSASDEAPYATPNRFTLCRCGGSGNKPFCDGSHWGNGFTDD